MNALYPTFKAQLLQRLVGAGFAGGAELRAVVVDESYAYSANHDQINDVSPSAIVAGPVTLSGLALDGTIIRASNVDFDSAVVGRVAHAVIVYFAEGSDSFLLAYMDTPEDNSLPQNIISGQLRIRWNTSGICRI